MVETERPHQPDPLKALKSARPNPNIALFFHSSTMTVAPCLQSIDSIKSVDFFRDFWNKKIYD